MSSQDFIEDSGGLQYIDQVSTDIATKLERFPKSILTKKYKHVATLLLWN